MTKAIKVQMLHDHREAEAQDEEKIQQMKSKAADNFKEAESSDENNHQNEHQKELIKIAEMTSLPTQKGEDNLLSKQ
jgi:hypothetical protein